MFGQQLAWKVCIRTVLQVHNPIYSTWGNMRMLGIKLQGQNLSLIATSRPTLSFFQAGGPQR